MFSTVFYKLKSNFECPSYHSCELFGSLEACKNRLNEAVFAVSKKCIEATTELIGFKEQSYGCGWKGHHTCSVTVETGEVLAGPNGYVSVIEGSETLEQGIVFVRVVLAAALIGAGTYAIYKYYANKNK